MSLLKEVLRRVGAILLLFGCVSASDLVMSTYAGGGLLLNSGMPSQRAMIQSPFGISQDVNGVIYVTQNGDSCVEKIVDGLVITVAGVCYNHGATQDGMKATSTFVQSPINVAVDSTGVVYFSDYGALTVKKVSLDGVLSTVAGNGTLGHVDNEAGTSAPIGIPLAVWVNTVGTLYFSCYDFNSKYVNYISSSGTIVKYAGNDNGRHGSGYAATSTYFNDMQHMIGDSTGRIVFADGPSRRYGGHVKAISGTDRMVSTIMGSGVKGYNGEGLPATSADLANPNGVALDESSGDVYAAALDGNRVQVLRASVGLVYTVAGNGSLAEGPENGPATSGCVVFPHAMVWDTREGGQLFVTDSYYGKVRRIYDPTLSVPTPTAEISAMPTEMPTQEPTEEPSEVPSVRPTAIPTVMPSDDLIGVQTATPSIMPSVRPSVVPSVFVQPSSTGVGCAWSEEDDSCGGTLEQVVVTSSTSSSSYVDNRRVINATTITRTYRKRL